MNKDFDFTGLYADTDLFVMSHFTAFAMIMDGTVEMFGPEIPEEALEAMRICFKQHCNLMIRILEDAKGKLPRMGAN
jgi:hypothetical protein